MSDDLIFLIIGGFSAFGTTWIVQNKALREGFTNTLLRKLNKESIKKIPLKDHKVFTYLRGYNTSMGFFIFNSDTKSIFYQTFMKLLFDQLNGFCNDIIKNKETNTSLDNFILDKFNDTIIVFDSDLKESLIIPDGISKQVLQWKMMLLESLKKSIENVISDDLVESNYFKVYRILDLITGFVNIALSTGAITFNQMNGAFDKLKVEDVLIKKDS